jgi:hypothetical protein
MPNYDDIEEEQAEEGGTATQFYDLEDRALGGVIEV